MNHSERKVWNDLLEMAGNGIGEQGFSVRRKDAILAAHKLIRRYERTLRRIVERPEQAAELAADALAEGPYSE